MSTMAQRQRVVWTEDLETSLVELWQQHSCLYDLSSSSYHDRQAREKRWQEIAGVLQLPANEVKTRAASFRTQYGKLLKPKPSGSGQKPLTSKQQWILTHLDFLKPHVTHRTTATTLALDTVECEDIEGIEEEQEEDADITVDCVSSPEMATRKGDPTAPRSFLQSPITSTSGTPSPGTPLSASGQSSRCSTPFPEGETSLSASTLCVEDGSKIPRTSKTKVRSSDTTNIELLKMSLLKQIQCTLSSADNSEDVFGQQVASELKKIQNSAVQLRVRRSIMNMLYDAQEEEQARKHGHNSQFPPFSAPHAAPPIYGHYTPIGISVPSSPFHTQHSLQSQSQSLQPQPPSFLQMMNTDDTDTSL
ncbi:uncharacterized protein LOC125806764 [Astyanax mexicanus]|uniref:uncharacterized protein LOC125782598 n=1 Tax=Astyanax mexicanus TaxID=7994 RepID=UPI0020CB21FF|nr:uncharacterized protein LOC125782598 [Astyanax mexicanus]XP_049342435.1 uncharacterized protein LOC125806764 [Astyanax mexicanus]